MKDTLILLRIHKMIDSMLEGDGTLSMKGTENDVLAERMTQALMQAITKLLHVTSNEGVDGLVLTGLDAM